MADARKAIEWYVDALAARMAATGVTMVCGTEDSPYAGGVAGFHDPFGHRWLRNAPSPSSE